MFATTECTGRKHHLQPEHDHHSMMQWPSLAWYMYIATSGRSRRDFSKPPTAAPQCREYHAAEAGCIRLDAASVLRHASLPDVPHSRRGNKLFVASYLEEQLEEVIQ